MILKYIFILLFYCYIGGVQGSVRLQSSGPTVLGANITLTATFVDYPDYSNVEYKFVFRNVEKGENVAILSSGTVVNYTVKISKEKYNVGLYAFELRVYMKNKFTSRPFSLIGRDRIRVPVTDLLNGKLKLIQNGFDRSYGRVYPNEYVSHIIELSQEELQFLTDDNTYIVHWYIDCSLISSTGLSFDYTYENSDKPYILEALVEVQHNPYSSARKVISRRPDRLSGFKCAPINNSGYTYGYYKASVRADATDGSPPPPRATSENPSNTWQDSSSPDSTTGRSNIQSGGVLGYVKLQSSGPTVRGADLTLSATFVDGYPGVQRKYVFRNVDKQETVEILSEESVVNHTLKLDKRKYKAGNYGFEVRVYERNMNDPYSFRYLSSDRIRVPVTELLNGKLKLIQNGFDRSYGRVFPNEYVSHIIELSQEELQFLTDDNTYIVHWYIDCSLISSTGLSFDHTYENADKTYILEALVEVEHNPHSSARNVISRRPDRLSGFKCAPINNSGFTYGYYKASVRADATDGSPPPPRATSENPSNTWQDSTTGLSNIQSGRVLGYVKLGSSGPTVRGADLTLSATFVDGYPGVERKYIFRNVGKQKTVEILSKESVVNLTLKLDKNKYKAERYGFEVTVYDRNVNDPDSFRYLSSDRIFVHVTELLNGKLKLIQNGFDRSYGRVFPNEYVSHIIELSQEELQFLTDDNTYIVHWYIDCSLISSTGLSFDHTYENADKTYILEALVEVEHNPHSSARNVISRRPVRLSGFKCAPINNSGFTYGYYKASVRADATDGSPPPPRATSENPSNTWKDSSLRDSTTGPSHIQSGGHRGYVKLRNSGPIVRGAKLTLSATLIDGYPGVQRKYVFRNIDKPETVEILSKELVVNHTLKLDKNTYKSGDYRFEVRVYEINVDDPDSFQYLSSDGISVSVTELLNGKLKLIQNGHDRSNGSVFPNKYVNHIIELSQEELQFLTDRNTYRVNWYINCSLESLTGLSFDYKYENADKTYIVEALVEVEHKQYSSARGVISRRPDRLSGFKCAPINNSGYTYGYYKASVRADATDGSPPPPRATSENPSNTRQFQIESGAFLGEVKLRNSGPTVRGANLTLSATLIDGYPGVQRKYVFRNIDKPEKVEILSEELVVNHTLKLDKNKYETGNYRFEVKVYVGNVVDPFQYLGRHRIRVPVTELLNGKLKLIQNGHDRSNGRVFPNEYVNHIIELSQEELQFLTDDNTYIVHWYIDCSLISSTGLSFDYKYENADKTYIVEALVEVEHNQNSSAHGVISRRPDRLSGFKCAPIYNSGYTYGYYKASIRADATDGSPPPPTAVAEHPSNSFDSGDHKTCTTNANDALITGKDGHIKIAMDLVFHGNLNISSFQVDGN